MRELEQLHRRIEEAFSLAATMNGKAGRDGDARAGKNSRIPFASRIAARPAVLFALWVVLAIAGIAASHLWSLEFGDRALLIGVGLGTIGLAIVYSALLPRRSELHDLADALEKAQRENAVKSRFLATVSHDIRTPLSGIAGMSQLLGQTRLTPEQANYVAGIRQSATALSHLVDDLLDFVSIEAGRFQLRPQQEYIRPLIEGVVEMLASRAHQKDIEIACCALSRVPALASFDPSRLRQVLYNVIGNAVKFTSEGGVLVQVDLEENDLVIKVRDTGPGMTEEEQARIFLEFEQAGSDKDRAAGTGLGLTISRQILAQAGGTLALKSRLTEGSTFTIRLPVTPAADFGEVEARSATLRGTRALALVPSGPTREALTETITALGGQCSLLTVGQEFGTALDIIERGAPITDIIVDHRVAGQFSSLAELYPQLRLPNIRRIFLVTPESRVGQQAIDSGFDAWLVRPLRERSLVDVLQGRTKGIELREDAGASHTRPISRWTSMGGGLDVLLAEDDPVNRLLLRTVLQKAGHKVREAETCDRLVAAATALRNRPEVIVTDLSMPGGNGIDALAEIRAFERSAHLEEVPVIVITGAAGDKIRQEAMNAGATDVLTKPADPLRLSELVSSFASKRAV